MSVIPEILSTHFRRRIVRIFHYRKSLEFLKAYGGDVATEFHHEESSPIYFTKNLTYFSSVSRFKLNSSSESHAESVQGCKVRNLMMTSCVPTLDTCLLFWIAECCVYTCDFFISPSRFYIALSRSYFITWQHGNTQKLLLCLFTRHFLELRRIQCRWKCSLRKQRRVSKPTETTWLFKCVTR